MKLIYSFLPCLENAIYLSPYFKKKLPFRGLKIIMLTLKIGSSKSHEILSQQLWHSPSSSVCGEIHRRRFESYSQILTKVCVDIQRRMLKFAYLSVYQYWLTDWRSNNTWINFMCYPGQLLSYPRHECNLSHWILKPFTRLLSARMFNSSFYHSAVCYTTLDANI